MNAICTLLLPFDYPITTLQLPYSFPPIKGNLLNQGGYSIWTCTLSAVTG